MTEPLFEIVLVRPLLFFIYLDTCTVGSLTQFLAYVVFCLVKVQLSFFLGGGMLGINYYRLL